MAPWPLPSPADSPFRARRLQRLTLERDGRRLDLMAVLEPVAGGLQLAGLTPAGQRLLFLRWDAAGLEAERGPGVPDFVDPGQVLRDVVLAHWPMDSLREALQGSGWSVVEADGGGRLLSREGRPWLQVTPEPGGRRVRHLIEGYDVVAQDLEDDDEE